MERDAQAAEPGLGWAGRGRCSRGADDLTPDFLHARSCTGRRTRREPWSRPPSGGRLRRGAPETAAQTTLGCSALPHVIFSSSPVCGMLLYSSDSAGLMNTALARAVASSARALMRSRRSGTSRRLLGRLRGRRLSGPAPPPPHQRCSPRCLLSLSAQPICVCRSSSRLTTHIRNTGPPRTRRRSGRRGRRAVARQRVPSAAASAPKLLGVCTGRALVCFGRAYI